MDVNNSTNFPKILTDKIFKFSKEKDDRLFEYQKIISQYMMEDTVRGILLFWEVGLGKTMLAINIAELFRKLDNKDIIIISPKSLKDNFVTTLQKYVQTSNNLLQKNKQKINDEDGNDNNDDNDDNDNNDNDNDNNDYGDNDYGDNDNEDDNNNGEDNNNYGNDDDDNEDKNNDDSNIKNGSNEFNKTKRQYKSDRYENYDNVVKKYSFITYGSPNMIKEMLKSSIKESSIKDEYSTNKTLYNKFIIVDEAHNLFNSITNGANIATQFYELIMKSKNIKLLFLTGTPIVNNFFEIVPALNMCKGYIIDKMLDPMLYSKKNKQIGYTILPESYDDFVNMFVDSESNKVKNIEKFKNRIYGLISYYGQFYFNKHIPFQKQIQESVEKENFPILLPIKFVKVNMDHDQNNAFLTARAKEKAEVVRAKALFKKFGKGFFIEGGYDNDNYIYDDETMYNNDDKHLKYGAAIDKNKSMGSSSYRIRSRQISNIYIPDLNDLKILKNKNTKNSKSKTNTNNNEEISVETAKILNIDLSKYIPPNLKISPKFEAIINNALKHKNQLGIIYSNFLRYGLLAISKFLDDSPYKGKYALFTGDIDIDTRNDLVKTYNSLENAHGEKIELLLISSTGEKGLNLKRVRHIHIMEPNWSYTTTEQVIGRGVRYKSHDDLPEDEKNVQVYEYLSDFAKDYIEITKPTELTTDVELFYKSVKNKEINDDFLKILASTSVECPKFNKYFNFNCYMCESNSKILYLPNIRDDLKMSNPCKEVKLYEVIIEKKEYYYDKQYNIYEKNQYGFFIKNDNINENIINKIKKMDM